MQGQAMFSINGGKQKGNSYICADGERIDFQPLLFSDSEWNGTVVKNVDAGSSGVQRKRVSGDNTPVGLKLRTLQPGEFCSVERRYTENNHYSFTSGKDIECFITHEEVISAVIKAEPKLIAIITELIRRSDEIQF